MKDLAKDVLCAALMCSCVSAFFVGSPLPVRSKSAARIRTSWSLPVRVTEELGQQQLPSDLRKFAVGFEEIREAFEADSTGPREGEANLVGRASVAARTAAGVGAAALAPLVTGVAAASAKGGAFGIYEGKTASFIHPIIMVVLFTVSVRSALLGFEWREQRTMSTRQSELKAQLPMLSSGSRASTPLSKEADGIRAKLEELGSDAGEAAAALQADLAKLASSAAKEVESELDQMAARRKELASKNVRDRHYDLGALLLGLGTFAAIEGPVNTYLRAEKLFPGPHLYAGAGCVVAWAVAASLVPKMQKGNDLARTAHIAINLGMIGLFAWQIFTGVPIALKVWELTKFP